MAISHSRARRVGVVLAGLLLPAALPTGAKAAQATGSASAAILSPVTVTKVDDLAFGKVIAGAAPASVTVTPLGGFTCGTGLTCLDAHSPARFTVSAAQGQTVRVDLDPQITLSSPSGGRMVATLEANTIVNRTPTLIGGTMIITIGGVLNVGAYQAEGIYTGTFSVNVDYN